MLLGRRKPLFDVEAGLFRENQPAVERVPTEPQRIFKELNGIAVMVYLLILFVLNYYFLNGYITLLLFCIDILIAGALETPGNTLRLVESDPWVRRFKVKFSFLFCGSLSLYLIMYFGLYFNRSCLCNWGA